MTFADQNGADDHGLLRLGGVGGLVLGATYVVIVVLFSLAGPVPSGGGGEWLDYLDGKTTEWWWIAALSVLTDLLYLPLAAALFVALRKANRNLVLVGTTLLGMFVVLDLAVTWPNYASLLTLAGDYAAATGESDRAAIVAAATYPASVLGSSLFSVYAIGVPGVGIGLIGLVMLRSAFGRMTAWVGVLTSVFGVASVVGGLFVSGLGALAIVASVLTMIWVMLAGYRLLRL